MVIVAITKYYGRVQVTAGHWPISDHFSKMANQNSAWCIHFVHMVNHS